MILLRKYPEVLVISSLFFRSWASSRGGTNKEGVEDDCFPGTVFVYLIIMRFFVCFHIFKKKCAFLCGFYFQGRLMGIKG